MVKITNLKKFTEQWEAQLQALEDEIIIPAQARFAELLLVNLQQGSPVWSGYYASNHRINLGGGFPLVPRNRPEDVEQNRFIGNIASSRQIELSKLQDRQVLKGVVNIRVGTAVPYALELEGRGIYRVAVRNTLAAFKVETTGRT